MDHKTGMMGIPACEAYLTRNQSLPLGVDLDLFDITLRLDVAQKPVRTIFQHARRIKIRHDPGSEVQ